MSMDCVMEDTICKSWQLAVGSRQSEFTLPTADCLLPTNLSCLLLLSLSPASMHVPRHRPAKVRSRGLPLTLRPVSRGSPVCCTCRSCALLLHHSRRFRTAP